jgi:hypothetical protein
LIKTQPVRQDPPFTYCILHISYSLYILHILLSTSDDELEAPGTEILSVHHVRVTIEVSLVKTVWWKNDVVTKVVDGDIVLDVITNCLPCKAEVVALGGKIKSSFMNHIQWLLVGVVTRWFVLRRAIISNHTIYIILTTLW